MIDVMSFFFSFSEQHCFFFGDSVFLFRDELNDDPDVGSVFGHFQPKLPLLLMIIVGFFDIRTDVRHNRDMVIIYARSENSRLIGER